MLISIFRLCKPLYDTCMLVEDKPRLMVPFLFSICYMIDGLCVTQVQIDILKNVLHKLLALTNSKKYLEDNERFHGVLQEYISKFSEDPDRLAIISTFEEFIDTHVLAKEEAKRKRSMTQFLDPICKYKNFDIEVEEIVPQIRVMATKHESKIVE